MQKTFGLHALQADLVTLFLRGMAVWTLERNAPVCTHMSCCSLLFLPCLGALQLTVSRRIISTNLTTLRNCWHTNSCHNAMKIPLPTSTSLRGSKATGKLWKDNELDETSGCSYPPPMTSQVTVKMSPPPDVSPLHGDGGNEVYTLAFVAKSLTRQVSRQILDSFFWGVGRGHVLHSHRFMFSKLVPQTKWWGGGASQLQCLHCFLFLLCPSIQLFHFPLWL